VREEVVGVRDEGASELAEKTGYSSEWITELQRERFGYGAVTGRPFARGDAGDLSASREVRRATERSLYG
jgi:hypothetical protein